MASASQIKDHHQSFNAGELSPLLGSRSGIEKYGAGGSIMRNFLPLPQGPMTKRPGTLYIADAKVNTGPARLMGFNFSDSTYGIFEMTDGIVRVYYSNAVVSNDLNVPWDTEQIAQVQFAQVNNTIYGAQAGELPQLFTRDAALPGGIAVVGIGFGASGNYPPLLDENVSDTTITPSATSGSVTLTASAAAFAAGNVDGFYELAQVRTEPFAEVIMGDTAGTASTTFTFTGNPADGDTITLNDGTARVFTFKSVGRTAVDQISIDPDTDDTIDNFIAQVNTGGAGAEPEPNIKIQKLGGVKASASFGNNTGTNVSDTETVTIGGITYTFNPIVPGSAAYLVSKGSSLTDALTNLKAAINLEPANGRYVAFNSVSGEYTQQNPKVEAVSITGFVSGFVLNVQARVEGAGGNQIALAETSATAAWIGAVTLMSGGTTVLSVLARQSGAEGNAYTASESSSAITGGGTFAGGTDETDTADITVVGKFEVRTTGRWTGKLSLQQQRYGSATWDTIQTWESHNDYNVNFQGEYLRQTALRLTFTGSGERQDLTWPRAILEPTDPYHRSLYLVTNFTNSTTVTATVLVAPISTAATKFWSEGSWSTRRGYPRAVCFHQNRLWYGGTAYEPFKLWASQLGDFLNFRYLSSDDGAMSFQLASTDLQQVQWLASAQGIVIGTTHGEWVGTLGDNSTVITPTNPPQFQQHSSYGSEYIQPVVTESTVIYVERYGRRVRRMFYDSSSGGYVSSNLTVLAEHLTLGGISMLALQKRPETVLWCKIENVGEEMACLTYETDQNVYAWSQVTGQMAYEGVASVNGPTGEEVWQIGKIGSTRLLQRADINTLNRSSTNVTRDVYLDCTTIKSGASFTSIALPAVMIGKTVTVRYGDGSYESMTGNNPLTVTATTYAQVGFPISSLYTTMRLDIQLQDGSSSTRAVRINTAVVQVLKSQGGNIYPGNVYDINLVEPLSYPSASATYSGDLRQATGSSAYNDSMFSLFHIAPWPFTVTALCLGVAVGDFPAVPYIIAET